MRSAGPSRSSTGTNVLAAMATVGGASVEPTTTATLVRPALDGPRPAPADCGYVSEPKRLSA